MNRPAETHPVWQDARVLAAVAQALFVVLLAAGIWGAKVAVERSMARQNIRLDWGFFKHQAGFELTALTWTVDLDSLSFKRYSPEDSYAEAIIAGLFNTIKVAVLGIGPITGWPSEARSWNGSGARRWTAGFR